MRYTRNWLLASALALTGAFTLDVTPAQARTDVTIYANVPPPPMRREVMPPPRHGFVWAPGYWNWHHGRYVWRDGHWVRARHGYHYVPDRWERHGKRWRHRPGYWGR